MKNQALKERLINKYSGTLTMAQFGRLFGIIDKWRR
jgi:hypothetical protein